MSMKLAFLLPALFLAFPHGHAGAAPFEPSVLEALQPPAEHGAFHSGWIALGLKAADLEEKQVSPGHITDVGEAQIQLYFPAGWKPQDRRAALCIFPGGGYAIQAIEKEGGHIARWAAEHGMVGVVVKYRVSGSNDAVGRFPGPLLDARQALRVTRRHASALGVDPHRIGVMGFSAGGHLAAMASTLWNRPLPEEAENPLKSVSVRPDFSLLIYPVITMDPKTTHGGTRSRILGPAPGA
ncbi:alpha/beta hydrolase, partial [Akkermansia sp.]